MAAWVTYDLANTIFALGVQGLYFATWVTVVQRLPDAALSIPTSAAMIVVIVTAPLLGARTDHAGRRVPSLVATTAVAVAATAVLATLGPLPSLIFYGVALIGFNLGSVVYDALLPDVSTPENRGRISGLGVAIGYVGSVVAVLSGRLILDRFGYAALFRVLALLFLLFALPAFLWIREPARTRRPGPPPSWRRAVSGLVASWRRARSYPGLARFLVGRFLYSDAINTLIAGFLAVFAQKEMGFSAVEVERLTAVAIVGAIGGGLAAGRLVDRWGPRRVLHRVLDLWMVAMALGIVAALTGAKQLGWLLGLGGGLALGGTWTADRAYMARLSPPSRFGEFYGLYGTVGRFATVVGPLLWGLIVSGFGWPRELALGTLMVAIVAARVVLFPVDDQERLWSAVDRGEG